MKQFIIEKEKLGDTAYWDILFKMPEADFKKLKKQSKRDLINQAYLDSPDNIRLDKDWVMTAMKDYYLPFYVVDNAIKDKEYCLRYIEECKYPHLFGIPEEFQFELFEKAVVKYPTNIKDLWYQSKYQSINTKENLCKWVEQNPDIYKELEKTSKFRNDFTIAELAVSKKPILLFKMNKSIAQKVVSRNLPMAIELLQKDRRVFPLLPLKLRNNKDFVLSVVEKLNYDEVPFIGPKSLECKEVLLGMRNFYNITVPECYHTDREVAYHIIKQSNYIFEYLEDCQNFSIKELIRELLINTKEVHYYKKRENKYKEDSTIISAMLDIGYYKEFKKIKKQSSLGYEYEDNQLVDISVFTLLDDDLQKSLIKEFKTLTQTKNEPSEKEILNFARSKYLKMNLEDKMDDKLKVKPKKI